MFNIDQGVTTGYILSLRDCVTSSDAISKGVGINDTPASGSCLDLMSTKGTQIMRTPAPNDNLITNEVISKGVHSTDILFCGVCKSKIGCGTLFLFSTLRN